MTVSTQRQIIAPRPAQRYLAAYSDEKNAGIDPLPHYVANGQAEGRTAFHV